MPTVTATVHQLLRYFFVGAIAVFWAAFLVAPSGGAWPDRVRSIVAEKVEPSAIGFMVLVGSLIYGVHRVVIYPFLHFLVTWSAFGWSRTGFPWGHVSDSDVDLEVWRIGSDPATEARQRDRFMGWASEIHLFYAAIEVTLVSFAWAWWPDLGLCPINERICLFLGLLSTAVLVWAWDRQVVLLRRRIHAHYNPTVPASQDLTVRELLRGLMERLRRGP